MHIYTLPPTVISEQFIISPNGYMSNKIDAETSFLCRYCFKYNVKYMPNTWRPDRRYLQIF